jgi:EAL domain-containing protein (putative c-di-GMP-specific phosphodiesterase class I)
MERLRGLGVRLAIDDVGAGFAGLRHLLVLEPDLIKLDRVLTGSIGSPSAHAFLRGLAAFADESGVPLLAEGIEEEETVEFLVNLGIQFGQGYHLGRPGILGPELLARFEA